MILTILIKYTDYIILTDSVGLYTFMARRALQGMVAPFTKSATTPWAHTNQPPGASVMLRLCIVALTKGSAIGYTLRLDAKHHRSAELANLMWSVY